MIIHWLVSAVAILITAYLLPGVTIDGFLAALLVAVVLGAINLVLRPVLVVLTLPITVMTLGFFILIINALLILLSSYIVPGFAVASFWWAFLFGIVLAVINYFFDMLAKEE